MSIGKTIRRKRLKAGLLGTSAGLLSYAILYNIWYPFGAYYGIGFAFVITFIASNYFKRTKIFLIWFRRFNEKEKRKFNFSSVLDIACSDLCIPITIQDSRFKRSYTAISSKWLWLYILCGTYILAIWGILATIIIMLSFILLFPGSGAPVEGQILYIPIIVFGFISSVVIMILFCYKFRERLDLRGFYTLNDDTGIDVVSKLLSRISKRLFNFHGILILKCPDEIWKQIVEFVLGKANVVLIDVSEPTENLLWELETSLRMKPKDSIIIACSVKKDELEQLPKEIQEAVMHITGESDLAGLKVFYYPAEKPSFLFGETRAYNSAAKRFREEVGSLFLTQ
jgi:hypothetical protein